MCNGRTSTGFALKMAGASKGSGLPQKSSGSDRGEWGSLELTFADGQTPTRSRVPH
jgi:hypothetical protein